MMPKNCAISYRLALNAFRFGLYVTLYADSLEELGFIQHNIETLFGQQLVYSKVAGSQQEQGLNSTIPQMSDQLQIRRNMNTGAISTSFPFTSADLTQEKGVLYGVNMHNNGLVIFDRYSLENANMVVFAKSGAGKSFTVKLEAIRTMMMGRTFSLSTLKTSTKSYVMPLAAVIYDLASIAIRASIRLTCQK